MRRRCRIILPTRQDVRLLDTSCPSGQESDWAGSRIDYVNTLKTGDENPNKLMKSMGINNNYKPRHKSVPVKCAFEIKIHNWFNHILYLTDHDEASFTKVRCN